MSRYNVVVIGGGSAGLMVAAGAAGLGARVALVEGRLMGGDCLNFGCVPSKALLSSAKAVAQARSGTLGLGAVDPPHAWEDVSGYVADVIGTIAPHDSVERFESLGVDVVLGRGRLTSPHSVEVALADGGTRTLEGKAVVLATGSSPFLPPIPGLAEAGYQTNETVFTMPTQPRRLLVLGGGPIGCELSQAFARLGSEVTLVEKGERILAKEDADAGEVLAASLQRDDVRIHTRTEAVRVESLEGGRRVHCRHAAGTEQAFDVDDILVAVGRRANVEGLGLDAAGVATTNGHVQVDARLRTTAPSVYACGDVAGPYLFTHTANQQARVVIQNALLPFKAKFDTRVVPWCTFTAPEVGRVGLNEDEARARGIPYRTVVVPFAGIDRAVAESEREGFLKLLTPPGRDDILGATLVGAHAGELLHEVVLAMSAGLKLRHIANTIHVYPTLAEIFRRAGDESRKAGFKPWMQRLLGGYLRWHRR